MAVIGENAVDCNLLTYCQNNPITYYDPSGHVIVIAESATDEEIEQYERAVAYIKKSDVGRALIEKLENSEIIFTIAFTIGKGSSFSSEYQVISINIYNGLILKDGSVQCPALSLAHEMGHAAQYIDGDLTMPSNLSPEGREAFKRRKEEMNVATWEIPIAEELGIPHRPGYSESIGWETMNNSTHYRTTGTHSFWWSLRPRNWGKSRHFAIEHNAT